MAHALQLMPSLKDLYLQKHREGLLDAKMQERRGFVGEVLAMLDGFHHLYSLEIVAEDPHIFLSRSEACRITDYAHYEDETRCPSCPYVSFVVQTCC